MTSRIYPLSFHGRLVVEGADIVLNYRVRYIVYLEKMVLEIVFPFVFFLSHLDISLLVSNLDHRARYLNSYRYLYRPWRSRTF